MAFRITTQLDVDNSKKIILTDGGSIEIGLNLAVDENGKLNASISGTVSFDDLTEEQKRQLKGDPGPQGPAGPLGEKGDPGIKGNDGALGARGQDGDDAYTIAVKNGYVGSVTKWLEDLKGTPGKDGIDGKDGANGEPGASGRGITNVLEYYLASSLDSGVTRETSGWSTQIPTLTNTNKYLWNYEVINYSSGNPSYTEPAIIGVYGNDGRGIVQVKEYYLATSLVDGVTRETPGWTESILTITPVKKYLWNYEEIIYDSGEPAYTDPVIIGAYGEKGDPGEEFDPYNFDDWSQLEYFSNLALQVKNNKEAIAAIGTGAQYCVPCTAEDNPEDCTLCEEGDLDCLEEYGQYGRKCTTISQAFAEFETKWGGSIAQIQSETQICYDSDGNIVDPDDEEAEVDHCVANNKAFLNLATTVNSSIANLETNYYKKDDVDGAINTAKAGLLLKSELGQAIAQLNTYYTKQEVDGAISTSRAGLALQSDLDAANATLSTTYKKNDNDNEAIISLISDAIGSKITISADAIDANTSQLVLGKQGDDNINLYGTVSLSTESVDYVPRTAYSPDVYLGAINFGSDSYLKNKISNINTSDWTISEFNGSATSPAVIYPELEISSCAIFNNGIGNTASGTCLPGRINMNPIEGIKLWEVPLTISDTSNDYKIKTITDNGISYLSIGDNLLINSENTIINNKLKIAGQVLTQKELHTGTGSATITALVINDNFAVAADGSIGVVVDNNGSLEFRSGLNLSETGYDDIVSFINSGTTQAGYTIRNGLIVRK